MSTEEQVYASKVKYAGVFSFKDLYKFCYDWLSDETGVTVAETKYEEKIGGNAKNVLVEWTGTKKLNDYFQNKVTVVFRITNMEDVEAMQGSAKVKANKGSLEIGVKGILVKDYDGKWESSAWSTFWRKVYEKYVIPATVKEYKDKLTVRTDEFVSQAKAYLALEGEK